jgi:anti-sigma regulatory factor (Ser/Thr protein kinase)
MRGTRRRCRRGRSRRTRPPCRRCTPIPGIAAAAARDATIPARVTPATAPAGTGNRREVTTALVHQAFFYGSGEEYVAGVGAFLEEGAAAGEPMLVAVPAANGSALRAALNGCLTGVDVVDMGQLGRNPGRIIPAIRAFVDEHGGRRVRFVGEPLWPGRSPAETVEATRHEALINLAFAGLPATILCPYDARGLAPDVLADARCTHPELVDAGGARPSRAYAAPERSPIVLDAELPEPDAAAAELPPTARLAEIRRFTEARAEAAGLPAGRATDLLLAVNEVAANSLRHAGCPPRVRAWEAPRGLIVELADPGHIADPLAGRRHPSPESEDGRGLWLVNQLCDLVQLRSSAAGTRVRLHVRA